MPQGERTVRCCSNRGRRWVKLLHTGGQRHGNCGYIARIGLDMRIARGMHVAHRAVKLRRNLKQPDLPRRLELAGGAWLDVGVAAWRSRIGIQGSRMKSLW